MRLLLADDHTLFRDALVQFIERAEPDAVVMLAKDMNEVMEIMEGGPELDLILLDLRMPGMDGLQGLKKLREDYQETPVALLSGMAERHHVEQAMDLGAAGYFSKTMSGRALLNGIRQVLQGENYVAMDHNSNRIMPSYYAGNDSAQKFAASDMEQGRYDIQNGTPLTPREKEVLSYLLKGSSNKDIARALDLQVVTIKLHVRGICRKLGAKNRTQAALKAQQMELISQG